MDIYPTSIKHCNKCNITKPVAIFSNNNTSKDGYAIYCKQCMKEYYQNNKSVISEKMKEYHQNNKSAISEKMKEYRQNNKEVLATNTHAYQQNNKTVISNRRKDRCAVDALYNLTCRIRSSITGSLRNGGYTKNSVTQSILGCSFSEFYNYIENYFYEDMNWDNRDKWHLDHIVPVSFGKTEEEIIMLNHYTNFRPLWAIDNLLKSDSLTEESVNHVLYRKLISLR